MRTLSADIPIAMAVVGPPEHATPARAVVRPLAAVIDLVSPKRWPALPGPLAHPPFPAVLGAVLLACVALGFRGDRRDPKLVAAAIDTRDGRARFR